MKKYGGLRKKVERIIKKHPGYGYRRLKDELDKQEIVINTKPLRKLLKLWHLQPLRRVKSPKPSKIAQYLKDLGIKANLVALLRDEDIQPFQVIYTDFTELPLSIGTFQFIPFSDHCTRRIIGWEVSTSPDAQTAIKAYCKGRVYLKRMKIDLSKTIIHQDQGAAFTSYEYMGILLNDNISVSFTQRGFKDNPAMESCIGHFKDEYFDQIQEARNFKELRKIIGKCVRDWNSKRIHSALKGRSPDEFIRTLSLQSKKRLKSVQE